MFVFVLLIGSDIVLCDNPETTLVRTIPNEDYYNLSQTRDVSIDNLKEYTADKKRRGVMKSEFDVSEIPFELFDLYNQRQHS